MQQAPDEDVLDIVETISSALGNTLNVASTHAIPRPAGKTAIADASLAFFADGKRRGDDIVLLVSNPQFPHVVAEDVGKARTIVQRVDEAVGHHIAQPVYEGKHGQQTFAAFRRLAPLSSSRLIRYRQKKVFGPQIASWLSSLALQTRTDHREAGDLSTYLFDPLKALSENSDINPALRKSADGYIERLSQTSPTVSTTVEHSDFWTGNVLFERGNVFRPSSYFGDFFVIDWRGSALDGYPCIDVVRFCTTLYGTQARQTSDLLAGYRKALGLSASDMGLYCTLGLGRLAMNIDKFPIDRFNQLSQRIEEVIDANGLGPKPQDG